jgi:hypothetical protein
MLYRKGGWVDKLKADQQEGGAELAVLATVALPKEIANFGPYGKKKNKDQRAKLRNGFAGTANPCDFDGQTRGSAPAHTLGGCGMTE